jgi:hypothetical protein
LRVPGAPGGIGGLHVARVLSWVAIGSLTIPDVLFGRDVGFSLGQVGGPDVDQVGFAGGQHGG